MAVRPLVNPSWLAQQLKQGAKHVRVLDGSWFLPSAKREPEKEFYQKRIPGARFFDIDECRDKSTPYEHMIPSTDDFSKYVSNLGITNESHVVVYDNNEKLGVFSAPRVWWTFRVFGHERVSVLNGGLPKWCAEEHPTESGPLKEESFESTYEIISHLKVRILKVIWSTRLSVFLTPLTLSSHPNLSCCIN